ncbi:Six-hairpin glycosidase-like protein [Xylaria nigripes]|nr:Six-hairpin glycosidase-like protein [Xylaria nigripes]
MRTSVYAAVLAAALFDPATAAEKTYLSKQMATSIMSRSQGIMTGYGGSSEALQAGFVQKMLTALSERYPEIAIDAQNYIQTSASSAVQFLSNATIDVLDYPLDRLSNGNALMNLDPILGLSEFRAAANALRQSIHLNPRTTENGLWYFKYPNWAYLDGMFSLAPFYTQYTLMMNLYGEQSFTASLDDMLYQIDLLWNHTRHSNGLLSHGYDATRTAVWADPVTGSSPWVWGRSLGWYTMALADTIEILNKGNAPSKYATALLDKFQALIPAVITAVDNSTGGWLQIVDQHGREGNYIESSATAMFTYSLLKGARLGYLPKDVAPRAVHVGIRAYTYLTDNFIVKENNGTLSYNGTVAVCSLNSTATYDYYVSQPIQYNSVLGSGAFVLASIEYERL